MGIVVLILVLAFISISLISFVLGNMLDKRLKQNKDEWFANHSEEECALVTDYIEFTKQKKDKKDGKKKKNKN